MKRLIHVVGVDKIPPSKRCLVIVDESDEMIMRNPEHFLTKTKNKNAKVVCLTATPDDGYDDSLERNLMNLLGYRLVRTEKKDE